MQSYVSPPLGLGLVQLDSWYPKLVTSFWSSRRLRCAAKRKPNRGLGTTELKTVSIETLRGCYIAASDLAGRLGVVSSAGL